jgi:tRNA-Thr(GGU) m(6)t(6)A37 methyltransferase TsaA
MRELVIKPIGIVKNKNESEILKYANQDIELDTKTALKQGGGMVISEIIINEDCIECLDGIEDFSHLIVLFWTHKNPNKAREIKKVHPAGLKMMPVKGIFATRSPVRPNPICETTVRLLERRGNILIVDGLDAIDNTPIIDIKPHLPYYDSPLDVKLADWMYNVMDELKKLMKNTNKRGSRKAYSVDMRSHPCISSEQKRTD